MIKNKTLKNQLESSLSAPMGRNDPPPSTGDNMMKIAAIGMYQ